MTLKSVGTMSSPSGSVFIRIALLIAITTTIVVAAFSLQSYRMVTRTAEFGVRLYGEESTSSLSQRLGGAFKFKKVEDVHDALKHQLEVAGDKALAAIALDADGTMIASVRARNGVDPAALEKLAKSSLGAGDVAKSMDGFTIAHPVIFGNNGESVGTIAIAWSPESVLADLKSQMIRSFIVTAGVFLVALAAAVFYLFRSIGQPLRRVSHAIDQVAQRRYDFEVPEIGRSDEVGSIAQNLSNLKDHLAAGVEAERERRKLQIEQSTIVDALMVGLERVSKGDLTYKIDTPFSSDYEKLRQNYNSTVDTLSNMIDHVVRNSSNIRENSGAITKSSDDLSRRTENQAATLEQTAASLDMITSSVKAAAEGAVAVEKIVDETRTNAVASDEVVKRAMNAMSEIEKSSYEISQIISVIDDISFQTNLLALNAGVEAARAGEAGKGFAVVASEVRALAQKSSTSAMEINTLIQQSSDQVKAGVGLVRNAGDALAKIVEKIFHISELVSNISQGAGQQAASLAEINSGVTQLDRVTQQNAAMVEETTAASHTLSSDAQELFELVRNFKTMTGQGAGNFGGSKRLRVAG